MLNGVPETKIEVAEKIFGVKYHTLWRWETYGVPRRKLTKVDAILCKLEKSIKQLEQRGGTDRYYGLMNPYGFKTRLSRIFPVLWKKAKQGENDQG